MPFQPIISYPEQSKHFIRSEFEKIIDQTPGMRESINNGYESLRNNDKFIQESLMEREESPNYVFNREMLEKCRTTLNEEELDKLVQSGELTKVMNGVYLTKDRKLPPRPPVDPPGPQEYIHHGGGW